MMDELVGGTLYRCVRNRMLVILRGGGGESKRGGSVTSLILHKSKLEHTI
jgi:hypothetical protein